MAQEMHSVVVFCNRKEDGHLFNKENIDFLADQLPRVKNKLEENGWPEFSQCKELYAEYYTAELADTIRRCNYGEVPQDIPVTQKFSSKTPEELIHAGKKIYEPKIAFKCESIFKTALNLIGENKEYSVCLHDPESPDHVGGGGYHGEPNLEEDLLRKSNLGLSLAEYASQNGGITYTSSGAPQYSDQAKLKNNEAHFTKDVTILKKIQFLPERHWYVKQFELLPEDQKWKVSFVGNAAIKCWGSIPFNFEASTKEKMRAHISAAIEGGVDCLILVDFGCGGFRNPPQTIARLYAELLIDEGYAKFFKGGVHFSIIGAENHLLFKSTFEKWQTQKLLVSQASTPIQKNMMLHPTSSSLIPSPLTSKDLKAEEIGNKINEKVFLNTRYKVNSTSLTVFDSTNRLMLTFNSSEAAAHFVKDCEKNGYSAYQGKDIFADAVRLENASKYIQDFLEMNNASNNAPGKSLST